MIARTAPMGWNSWNTFGANISDALVREMADAMVEKGYRDAGYPQQGPQVRHVLLRGGSHLRRLPREL